MKYRIATDYRRDGSPKWEVSEILHVTPPPEFEIAVSNYLQGIETMLKTSNLVGASGERVETWIAGLRSQAADKLQRRLGWMTRAHPFILENKRLIVPLYSDGFSFSLMAITDDWGQSWH